MRRPVLGMEMMADHERCAGSCEVCELFGELTPERLASIRAAFQAAPSTGSYAQKGRPKSPEHRARIAASMLGNTRAKGNAGRQLSAEQRARISAGVRQRKVAS